MPQIFHPSTNTISKASIFGGVFAVAALGGVFAGITRSSYVTRVGVVADQPVPFSHQHHVDGMGIDCRYCHTSVEESPFAGIPPTATCMTCHSQVWTSAQALEPVRESFRTDRSIEWTRVHDLPDFVYFDHSVHVARGVACETCHGRVDRMPQMWRESSLYMEWCLACHRHPEVQTGPREDVFRFGERARPPSRDEDGGDGGDGDAEDEDTELTAPYSVAQLSNCSICHR